MTLDIASSIHPALDTNVPPINKAKHRSCDSPPSFITKKDH